MLSFLGLMVLIFMDGHVPVTNFEVDGTPLDQHIHLISINFEGYALHWHQTFTRSLICFDIS